MAWFSWLRNVKPPSKQDDAGDGQQEETLRTSNMAELALKNHDLIKGWELSVTMLRRTPLEWLLRHGEKSDRPSAVPMQHAIWIMVLKSWRELGFDVDDSPPGTMASEIGQIPADGGDFLPFLIKYRTIVEGLADQNMKLEALGSLGQDYEQIEIALGGDLARDYVLQELQKLPGCAAGIAKNLLEAGFQSREQVQQASRAELLKIKGIGPKLAAKLVPDE